MLLIKKYNAIFLALLFTLVSVYLTYTTKSIFDLNRLQHIFSIASASSIFDFPKWAPIPNGMQLELFTPLYSSDSTTFFLLGENFLLYFIPVLFKMIGFNYPLLSLLIFFSILNVYILYIAFKYSENYIDYIFLILINILLIYFIIQFPAFSLLSVYYYKGFMFFILYILIKKLKYEKIDYTLVFVIFIFVIFANTRNSMFPIMYFFLLFIIVLSYYKLYSFNFSIFFIVKIIAIVLILKFLTSNAVLITNEHFKNLNQVGGHVFWHTIWCSIGAFDPNNIYGFKWSDTAASLYAHSVNSGVIDYTIDYENILRDNILNTFYKDPYFLFKYIQNRLFSSSLIFYVSIIINLIAIFTRIFKNNIKLIFIVLLSTTIFKLEEILSVSQYIYIYPTQIYTISTLVLFVIAIIDKYFLLKFMEKIK